MNRKWMFGLGTLGCLAIGFIGLLVVAGIAWSWGVSKYNGMVTRSQQVDAQWAQVQNVYQRRSDLIPNLVSTVQGSADFEKSTLQAVVEARASVGRIQMDPSKAPATAEELKKFQEAQTGLSSALSRLLVVSEQYPDLKANANFRDLQTQIEGSENRISVERMRFNDVTRDYNSFVSIFPNNLVAGHFHFAPKPYFQAEEKAQKAPDVKFDFKK